MKAKPPAVSTLPAAFDPDELEAYRKAFERGDKTALIQAIRICFVFEEVAPKWVVTAFLRASNKWFALEVKELGEAFGLTWPKGAHRAAWQKRKQLPLFVLKAVNDAKSAGRIVDDELFSEIGKRFAINKTTVKEYYKSARDLMRLVDSIESQKPNTNAGENRK